MTAVQGTGFGGAQRVPRDSAGNGHLPLNGREADIEKTVYARLRRIILLGGAVRPTALSVGIHRSLLDLPLERREELGGESGLGRGLVEKQVAWTLLDEWVQQARELSALPCMGHLTLMVMLDAASPAPAVRWGSVQGMRGGASAAMPLSGQQGERDFAGGTVADERVTVEIKRDPFEYRGTGGVLHDVARELDDDDYLVVATGAQVLLEPLKDLVAALARAGERVNGKGNGHAVKRVDVGILAHQDGTPSGLMLIRCGVLREISDLGFVDLKEQALPSIAKKSRVAVETRATGGGVSCAVRTTADYLSALRQYHRRKRGEQVMDDAFAEDWQAEFSVVEEGATVDASAQLYDSVVLAGARVGPGAVLVRSIVCGGAVVRARQRAVEQLFGEKRDG